MAAFGAEDATDDDSNSSYSSYDESTSDSEERQILEEMKHIPFDVLLKTKETAGTAGARTLAKASAAKKKRLQARGKAGGGDGGEDALDEDSEEEEAIAKDKKKKGKHMPKEISAKRAYNPHRESSNPSRRRKRDPRFDRVGDEGEAQRVSDRARENYDFVFREIMPQEERALSQRLKKAKGEATKTILRKKLKNLQHRATHHKSEKRRAETKKKVLKTTAAQSAKSGKKFYLKKSEMKKQLLLDKYNELKKKGKLEDYLAKKRRRNASKEHKSMPFNRRQD